MSSKKNPDRKKDPRNCCGVVDLLFRRNSKIRLSCIMIMQFIYPERNSLKWMMPLFVAVSCFAFSLSPVPANARQTLPSQIEEVVSSKDDQPVSFYKALTVSHPFKTVKRSRDYEGNIILHHKIHFTIAFHDLSEKFYSHHISSFQRFRKIFHQNSDEDPSSFHIG